MLLLEKKAADDLQYKCSFFRRQLLLLLDIVDVVA
jgi:hypothetical protein